MARANTQSGNILFLILMAVALFAFLSYAITQSSRSGGDTGEREQGLLGSGTLIQYPVSLRSALIRMTITGTPVENIMFNAPSNAAGLTTNLLVFHPDGGGASQQEAPADLMAVAVAANWYYNAEFRVPQVGKDGTGGNEIIAFLPGVNERVCKRINEQASIGGSTSGECGSYTGDIPAVNLDNDKITDNMVSGYNFPTGVVDPIECAGGNANAFTGKEMGCFFDSDLNGGQYVYYSVLIER